MDWTLLLLAGTGLFLAGILKGATGLGYSSCALPFLVSSVGLKSAMVLVLVPAMATNISIAVEAGHFAETTRRFWKLYLAMLPGIGLGLFLLLWLPQSIAVRSLGAVIVTYSVMSLLRPHFYISASSEQHLQIPAGFANGVIAGLTGSQVMPLFPFMMALDLDPNRLIQAINLAVTFTSIVLAAGLYTTGVMTPELALGSVIAILPAVGGADLGTRLRSRISASRFKPVVLTTLLGSGVLMLVR